MQLLPLTDVINQIKPGMQLPWGVRDATGKLLLARGHLIADAQMLQTLIERGMFVDAVEARAAGVGASGSGAVATPKEGFFGRWALLQRRLNSLLITPPADLRRAMDEVIGMLITLADTDPDQILFLILRHDQARLQLYGGAHSLHCGAVCCLTAKRMGWSDARRRSLVGAALTMNIAMIELQGQLAVQSTPPTPEQRANIQSHPTRSAKILRDGGITDPEWLQAVEQHHETPDGEGYPAKLTDIVEAAQMLRHVDIFAAKICARASRPAVFPNQAAREVFTENQGHPLAAALIKEFGVYPPGCFVKLNSGETAIVVRRGSTVTGPQVACLTNGKGEALSKPQLRDTSVKEHAVVSVTPEANVMVRVPWETLYAGS